MKFLNQILTKGASKKKGGQKKTRLPYQGIKNQTGQALTESLIALPLVSVCFVLCLGLFHGYTQQLWMDHQLYQALVCLAKGESKTQCKSSMVQKIKSFLWVGKLTNLTLYQQEDKWQGSFIWETPFWKIPFKKALTKRDLL